MDVDRNYGEMEAVGVDDADAGDASFRRLFWH